MNDEELLKQRNTIKFVGSLSAVLSAMSVGGSTELLNQGPGILAGIFMLTTVFCISYLKIKQ